MSKGKMIGIVFWSFMLVALYDVPWLGPIIGLILIGTEPLILLVFIALAFDIPTWLTASVFVGCIIIRDVRKILHGKTS